MSFCFWGAHSKVLERLLEGVRAPRPLLVFEPKRALVGTFGEKFPGGGLLMEGAIQKLHNGQVGERDDDFITYSYIYFEGRGYCTKQLRNGG